MLASVIVPFRNAEATLKACLEALALQTYREIEIILVDNGSTDCSREVVNQFIKTYPAVSVRLLTEGRVGASAARNTGAADARGPWLFFADSDCIPEPDWIADFAAVVDRDPVVGAFAGRIVPFRTDNIVGRFLGMYTLTSEPAEKEYSEYTILEGGFPTANLAVRKTLFNEVDGFDANIPFGGEDHDLCRRIYDKGYRIRRLSNAVVAHIHRTEVWPLCRQAYHIGESHGLLLRKLRDGVFIFQAPLLEIREVSSHVRIWVDLNQADKKLAGLLVLCALSHYVLFLLAAYLFWLGVSIQKRSVEVAGPLSWIEIPAMACLLVIKSSALTWGRLCGSFQNGVLCV